VTVFDRLADLPSYSEIWETRDMPESAVALRTAANGADAALAVTNYYGRVPAMVDNAIDCLTRRWNQCALHDKPLAVIGRAGWCYSGVWSHDQTDAHRITRPGVIESTTVATLHEAVIKLVGEVHADGEPLCAMPTSEHSRPRL
jgi:NADPH-dependent FMN reductase